VRRHAGTAVATLLRSLGSPEAIFAQLASAVTKFSTVTEMEPLEAGPGTAAALKRTRPGFAPHRLMCDYVLGMLSQPPVLFGLPAAAVVETQCQLRGDAACRYDVTWDADMAAKAADPQQLITALEAQVAAMADRLENVYAVARDLIAPADLDAALARITDRAATAVRAPRHLLAVRTGVEGKLHVHHRGFDGQDPQALATELLAARGAPADGAMAVSVTDGRERLGPNPMLRELLTGTAAQAATALANARLMEAMAHQARHDNLTGLLGHRAFHEALGSCLGGGSFTLATIDIDDFKRINDRYGHPVGDAALRLVAGALRRAVREGDAVFRVGGEEFAVLIAGLEPDAALPVAERLRAAVAAVAFREPLRVSVGLAGWDGSGRDALIERADAALYAAKRGGKDRTLVAA
jgi:diguanylate cyclase (GGDEF)-like protein